MGGAYAVNEDVNEAEVREMEPNLKWRDGEEAVAEAQVGEKAKEAKEAGKEEAEAQEEEQAAPHPPHLLQLSSSNRIGLQQQGAEQPCEACHRGELLLSPSSCSVIELTFTRILSP